MTAALLAAEGGREISMNPASGAPEGAGADLRRSVRQVVGAVAGYRGQQWQSCEELLSNLRLNDSNFHWYIYRERRENTHSLVVE